MGHIALPELAAAVSAAGGLGMLATSTLTPSAVRASLGRVRELVDAPFAANVTLGLPHAADNARVLVEERVPVLSLSLGMPVELVDAVHAYGGKVIGTVTSRRHARSAQDKGADALIVVGHEAAGHGSDVSSLVILPLVRAEVDVPVVAAGGFAGGAGLAAALVLGADGVCMGTRFALSAESPVHERVVNLLLHAGESDTVVTDRIDGIASRLWAHGRAERLAQEASRPPNPTLAGDTYASVVGGDVDAGVVAVGQVVGAVSSVLACRALVERTVSEASQILADAPGRLGLVASRPGLEMR